MYSNVSVKGDNSMIQKMLISGLLLAAGLMGGHNIVAADGETWDGTIVQHGKMHEAIGQQQHQGRVQLKTLVDQSHFYGVAALAKLEGEATIVDGKVTVTRVDANGQLQPAESGQLDESATLLVGAYVPSWTEHKSAKSVTPLEFDKYLAEVAGKAGLDTSKPFVFTVEGEFSKVSVHVINGACPMHARLRKIKLPKEKQPFEADLEKVSGTIVGIFAKDAVGDITHPDSSTHMHLVFRDAATGKMVTGHVEQVGLSEGAILRLPKTK
jgi:alpha-acetolactate decarboxylase